MDTGKILTHKGYSIRKDSITPSQEKRLIEDLTVCPVLNTKFASAQIKADSTFKIYRESPTRWYLPRHYGIEKFGEPDSSVLSEGLPLPDSLVFGGTPYQYQTEIIQSFVDAGANGLICVPCGKGKTFMALSIAARLRRRFLVVVDKEFLMNQWRGEMEALLPGIRIGIIQEDRKEIGFIEEVTKTPTIPELKARLKELGLRVGGTKDELEARLKEAEPPTPAPRVQYDCAIALIQTVVRRDFTPADFEGFGFTIFDECHHLGAQSFSRVLQRIQTKSMLGLSATPTREDGLTKVFFWFLGKPVYWEKTREPDPTVEVKNVMIRSDDVTYNTVPTNWRGEPVTAQLLTNILGCAERTAEIVRWVLRLAQDERKILVLSERIGHLEEIERLVAAARPELKISYYIGGMKEKVREEGAAAANVLLASYAMASEAMNIKTLNTVVLASPRKHVEQSTGRILRVRQSERTIIPVIVDIVDSHMMYRGQWRKRTAYYRQCAYNLESWSMGATEPERAAPKRQELKLDTCLLED